MNNIARLLESFFCLFKEKTGISDNEFYLLVCLDYLISYRKLEFNLFYENERKIDCKNFTLL